MSELVCNHLLKNCGFWCRWMAATLIDFCINILAIVVCKILFMVSLSGLYYLLFRLLECMKFNVCSVNETVVWYIAALCIIVCSKCLAEFIFCVIVCSQWVAGHQLIVSINTVYCSSRTHNYVLPYSQNICFHVYFYPSQHVRRGFCTRNQTGSVQ